MKHLAFNWRWVQTTWAHFSALSLSLVRSFTQSHYGILKSTIYNQIRYDQIYYLSSPVVAVQREQYTVQITQTWTPLDNNAANIFMNSLVTFVCFYWPLEPSVFMQLALSWNFFLFCTWSWSTGKIDDGATMMMTIAIATATQKRIHLKCFFFFRKLHIFFFKYEVKSGRTTEKNVTEAVIKIPLPQLSNYWPIKKGLRNSCELHAQMWY